MTPRAECAGVSSSWGSLGWQWLALGLAVALLVLVVSVPLTLTAQAVFAVCTFGLALWLNRHPGPFATLVLVLISVTVSSRYIYWRLTETLGFESVLGAVVGMLLMAAELYAFAVLLLGFFQTIRPLERKPVALPRDPALWPTIDVYIPTYNEPLKVVRTTILAALSLDWPQDKLNVYVLDDGRRKEFRDYAESVGAHYLIRPDNAHAKAGNINHALQQTDGELIAIFDCDHIPTRSFLQTTVGWFLREQRLGMLQTPHHFFTPDPFERNLRTFRRIPNEGELFYGLIQDGNDLWDATFFCGSCAVLRRSALLEVGGVAVETVTEDAHTALKMHRRGYSTAYLKLPQAAGLATESFSAHIGQRIRWARGLAQMFRIDNPFLGKGLKFAQRLCYANATLHYFYALPRLIFLTAPLSFLFFEAHVIQAQAFMIAALALPHIVHAHLTNNRIQGKYRHSLWSEVYESTLAYYILGPTLLALIDPRLGKFNVTAKGGIIPKDYFDLRIAGPHLVLLLLNLVGLGFGVVRLLWWNADELDTVVLNIVWTLYNVIILGATLAVAWETRQRRAHHRLGAQLSAAVGFPDGRVMSANLVDISEGGGGVRLETGESVEPDEELTLYLATAAREEGFPTRVVACDGGLLRLRFEDLATEQQRSLIFFLYARADAWINWEQRHTANRSVSAFQEISRHGLRGLWMSLSMGTFLRAAQFGGRGLWRLSREAARGLLALLLIGLSIALIVFGRSALAAPELASADAKRLTFSQLGAEETLRLEGVGSAVSVPFSIRADEVVYGARLRLGYRYRTTLFPEPSVLSVRLNDEVVTDLPIAADGAGGEHKEIAVDPRLLKDFNHIALHWGVVGKDCPDPVAPSPEVLVSHDSALELWTHHLPLKEDLALLPLPFFDDRDPGTLVLPVILAVRSPRAALPAAVTVSSWFGSLASYRGARFPVTFGALPRGNGIVLATPETLPAGLVVPTIEGATIAIQAHPRDPGARLLLLLGRNAADLLLAAQALVHQSDKLSGTHYRVGKAPQLQPRTPYDAPRWLPSDRAVRLQELAPVDAFEAGAGTHNVVRIDFRAAPDLFSWRDQGAPLRLQYRLQSPPHDDAGVLNITFNKEFISAVPLGTVSWYERLRGILGYEPKQGSSHQVKIPPTLIGQHNRLQLHFDAQGARRGCDPERPTASSLHAVIGRDSTIDVSRFFHFTSLPNLAFFANSGFPFTRLADLRETAVVLPSALDVDVAEVLLTVMGRLGAFTGYPAHGVSLIDAEQIDDHRDKDFIVLGSIHNQPLIARWARKAPLVVNQGHFSLTGPSAGQFVPTGWDGGSLFAEREAVNKTLQDSKEMAALLGYESPLARGRSVVVLTANTSTGLKKLTRAMLDPQHVSQIQGDVTLITRTRPTGFQVGPRYQVGRLPWWTHVRWWVSQHPWMLLVLLFIGAVWLAGLAHRALKARVAARL